MTRAAMIENLRSNHIRTLRSLGLPSRVIVQPRLARRGAAGGVLSRSGGGRAAHRLGGGRDDLRPARASAATSSKAALNRDYTLVMGTVVVDCRVRASSSISWSTSSTRSSIRAFATIEAVHHGRRRCRSRRTPHRPVVGRSLWADAASRLVRNRAAVISIVVLAFIAIACIFGRFVTGPSVRSRSIPITCGRPASLCRLPARPSRSAAIERIGVPRARQGRERSTIGERHRPHDPRRARARSTSGCSPISSAPTCSDRPRWSSAPDEGRRLVVERAGRAPVHFLFGTDANGRDLLTRTMKAGQHLARDRPARDLRRDRHRRHLRRDLRLSRRAGRPRHDAHRRRPLLAAVHLLRHHAGGVLRPELHADVHRRRRRRMARHGAHRARPDAVDQAAGIRPGRRGARRRTPAASSAATSSRTRSVRSSST